MEFCDNIFDKPHEIIGRYVFNEDKPELKGKKFCSSACMEKFYKNYRSQSGGSSSGSSGGGNKDPNSNFWNDYKGLIIGGIVILVLIIVLWIVFSIFGEKKKK